LKLSRKNPALFFALATFTLVIGCKSEWIDANIENHTGQPIQQLEVAYPSASFGTNGLAPEGSFHYRFQTRGSGPVKVDYITPEGKTWHKEGLTLMEHQEGQITVRLLPLGKIEFSANLQPSH